MTNKEFFIETIKDEAPRFRTAIAALPEDKYTYKVHEKSREAANLVGQLATQWKTISEVVTKGTLSFDPHDAELKTKDDMLAAFDKCMPQLLADLEAISEEDWENTEAVGFGGGWKDKKYKMAWGLLFDAIHHRGQVATFIRAMGGKVPSIYGPSADDPK